MQEYPAGAQGLPDPGAEGDVLTVVDGQWAPAVGGGGGGGSSLAKTTAGLAQIVPGGLNSRLGVPPILPLRPNRIASEEVFAPTPPVANTGSLVALCNGPDGKVWYLTSGNPGQGVYSYVFKTDMSGNQTWYACPNGFLGYSICAGPDGALWIIGRQVFSTAQFLKMSVTGGTSEYDTGISGTGDDVRILTGPDSNLWAVFGTNLAKCTIDGAVTTYAFPHSVGQNQYKQLFVTAVDGNMWAVTNDGSNTYYLEKITTAGVVTEYPLPSRPECLVAGTDGYLYGFGLAVTGSVGLGIWRYALDGTVTPIYDSIGGGEPGVGSVCVAPNGLLYYSNSQYTYLSGISLSEKVAIQGKGLYDVDVFTFTDGSLAPLGLIVGPDSNFWSIDVTANKILRFNFKSVGKQTFDEVAIVNSSDSVNLTLKGKNGGSAHQFEAQRPSDGYAGVYISNDSLDMNTYRTHADGGFFGDLTTTSSGITLSGQQIQFGGTGGNFLIRYPDNNTMIGTGTLSGGTVTIANTSIHNDAHYQSYVLVTPTSTSVNSGVLSVTAMVSDISFTVTSSNALDNNTFMYFILHSFTP